MKKTIFPVLTTRQETMHAALVAMMFAALLPVPAMIILVVTGMPFYAHHTLWESVK